MNRCFLRLICDYCVIREINVHVYTLVILDYEVQMYMRRVLINADIQLHTAHELLGYFMGLSGDCVLHTRLIYITRGMYQSQSLYTCRGRNQDLVKCQIVLVETGIPVSTSLD